MSSSGLRGAGIVGVPGVSISATELVGRVPPAE